MTSKKVKERRNTEIDWSWPAFFLGPLWYLWHGIWLQAAIMLLVIILGNWIMLLPVGIYCGLRFNEDVQELKKRNRQKKKK